MQSYLNPEMAFYNLESEDLMAPQDHEAASPRRRLADLVRSTGKKLAQTARDADDIRRGYGTHAHHRSPAAAANVRDPLDLPPVEEIELLIDPLRDPLFGADSASGRDDAGVARVDGRLSSSKPGETNSFIESHSAGPGQDVIDVEGEELTTEGEEAGPGDFDSGVEATLVLDKLSSEDVDTSSPVNTDGGYKANDQLTGTCSHCSNPVDLSITVRLHFLQPADPTTGAMPLGCRAEFTTAASRQGWAWLEETLFELNWRFLRMIPLDDVQWDT